MEPLEKISPEIRREVRDDRTGLIGFLVIDKQINGTATGGIRMAPDVSMDEIANLAREMTLKYALFRMKKDGAKAGIQAPAGLDRERRRALCRAFGEQISDLVAGKRYFPGEDLGTTSRDLAEIMAGAGVRLEHKKSELRSEYYTALTVFLTIRQLLAHHKKPLDRATVILEGFGKVGEHLLRFLSEQRARVVGVSTVHGAVYDQEGFPANRLYQMKDEFGDAFVLKMDTGRKMSKEDLRVQPCDVFVPGARPDSIHDGNVDQIKARFVVPVANIAATEAIEEVLSHRSVIFAPGFLTNAGGVLGHFLHEQGFSLNGCERILRKAFAAKVDRLIARAEKEGRSLSATARSEAWNNLAEQEKDARAQLRKKVSVGKALWLAHKKLLRLRMGFLLNAFAQDYMARRHFD